MERRKFVIGAGALATGSAAAMGTGAFTFAETTRGYSVAVADDSDAFLSLEASGGPNGDYADETDGGQLELNFNDDADVAGSGLNEDSVYLFDDVFRVRNQGSQTIKFRVPDITGNGDQSNVIFYAGTGDDRESIYPSNTNPGDFDDTLADDFDPESINEMITISGGVVEIDVGNEVPIGVAWNATNDTDDFLVQAASSTDDLSGVDSDDVIEDLDEAP